MARTLDELERRKTERLAGELLGPLKMHGYVAVASDEVENVQRWREAARSAARSLGERVRTGVQGSGAVWAVLPARRPSRAAQRLAALRAADLVDRTR